MEEILTPDLHEKNDSPQSPAKMSEMPTTWDSMKAMWNYTRMTATTEALKNLTPEDNEKLQQYQETLAAHDQRNFASKAGVGAIFAIEQSLANIASGNAFEEATQWVAATAGGLGIGGVGRTVGGMIGGAIGGAPGAMIGQMVGGIGGALVGSATAGSYVQRKFEYSKYKEAGIEIEEPNAWQTLVDVMENLPTTAATAGILSSLPAIYKIMNSAWKGHFNPDNAKKRTKAQREWLKQISPEGQESKDQQEWLGNLRRGQDTPPGGGGIGEPPNKPGGGGGKEKKPPSKKRYTMQDTLANGAPWEVRKTQTQPEEGSGLKPQKIVAFNQEKAIKDMQGVSDHVYTEHKNIMDSLQTTAQKEHYLYATSVAVADVEGSFYKDYTDILMQGLTDEATNADQLREVIAEHIGHPTAEEDIVRHLYGEQVDFSGYHPAIGKFADNSKKYLQKSASDTRKFGVPLQERVKYAPQKVDLYKVSKYPRSEVERDLAGWFDFQAAGHVTPAAQSGAVKGVYDSFHDQYNRPNSSYLSSGAFKTEPRVFIPKSAKAYMAYIKKYGRDDNIFETMTSHAFFTSRKHALINQFGPEPLEVLDKLLDDLPDC